MMDHTTGYAVFPKVRVPVYVECFDVCTSKVGNLYFIRCGLCGAFHYTVIRPLSSWSKGKNVWLADQGASELIFGVHTIVFSLSEASNVTMHRAPIEYGKMLNDVNEVHVNPAIRS